MGQFLGHILAIFCTFLSNLVIFEPFWANVKSLNCHPAVIEALISINNKLGQKEAATGLLEWGRKNLADLKVQERYYEKLHDWEKALKGWIQSSLSDLKSDFSNFCTG